MSSCCSSSGRESSHPAKHRCPGNRLEYSEVSVRSIAHHIQKPWAWQPTAHRYFFCEDPDCNIVYFADDDSTIEQSQLRTQIGLKDLSDDGMLCYCFGVTRGDFRADSSIRDFVIAQTKTGQCSCDTSNPSGRCCLKDFPKLNCE